MPSTVVRLVRERRRLEVLERELAEDRVVRVRDAERRLWHWLSRLVVAQVRLEHRADAAVERDLVVGIDAAGDERARGDELEHRRGRRPHVGREVPVERAVALALGILGAAAGEREDPAVGRHRDDRAARRVRLGEQLLGGVLEIGIERELSRASPCAGLVVIAGARDLIEIERRGGGGAGEQAAGRRVGACRAPEWRRR